MGTTEKYEKPVALLGTFCIPWECPLPKSLRPRPCLAEPEVHSAMQCDATKVSHASSQPFSTFISLSIFSDLVET